MNLLYMVTATFLILVLWFLGPLHDLVQWVGFIW